MTDRQTIANAASVPTEVMSPSTLMSKKPAATAVSSPTSSVLTQGVLNFGWTVEKTFGRRPSRAIV